MSARRFFEAGMGSRAVALADRGTMNRWREQARNHDGSEQRNGGLN